MKWIALAATMVLALACAPNLTVATGGAGGARTGGATSSSSGGTGGVTSSSSSSGTSTSANGGASTSSSSSSTSTSTSTSSSSTSGSSSSDAGSDDAGLGDAGTADSGIVDAGCDADTDSDRLNCGGCGQLCAVGQTCTAGTCGAPTGTTFSSFSDATKWSSVTNGSIAGWGAVFDGRYIYYIPCCGAPTGSYYDHDVIQYDTTLPFTAASFVSFDLTTVSASARDFLYGTFDGRYVYVLPNDPTRHTMMVYDTTLPFTAAASWTAVDVTTWDSRVQSFTGAEYDGSRYIYFIGGPSGLITRYDTTTKATVVFDASTVDARVKQLFGAVFDGRYYYFVPQSDGVMYSNGVALRYDTRQPFTSAASWQKFDTAALDWRAQGFIGGAFDGRYVYFIPNWITVPDAGSGPGGLMVRYDTRSGAFTSGGSWSTFDVSTVDPGATGFVTAAFDGRYLFLIPSINSSGATGLAVRCDTTGPFDHTSCTTYTAPSAAFRGSAFDGRYVYYVEGGHGVFARFDARTPPGAGNPPLTAGTPNTL